MYEGPSISTSWPTLVNCLFHYSHPGYEAVCHGVFGLHFPSNSGCGIEQLFMCLLAIYISFLEKCLSKFSACVQNWVVFLSLMCMSSLYILYISYLSDRWVANILFHAVCCLFTSWWYVGKLWALMFSTAYCVLGHYLSTIFYLLERVIKLSLSPRG